MRAPVSIRPAILGSPILPAPTARQRLPSSFTNIGNNLLMASPTPLTFHSARHTSLRQIASNRLDEFSGQKIPQLRVAVTSEKMPKILARRAIGEIRSQQPFDGLGNLGRGATKPHSPRDFLIEPERSTQAEVIGVHHVSADLDLLAFDSDVGDPVLSAAVRTTRHMQFQMLI